MAITSRWRRWATSSAEQSSWVPRIGWPVQGQKLSQHPRPNRWACRRPNCSPMAQPGNKCMSTEIFSEEQKQYLQGFITGSALRGGAAQATFASTLNHPPGAGQSTEEIPAGPEKIHYEAQTRFTAAGKELVKEEQAKRKTHPLDIWDKIRAHAQEGK